MKVLINSQKIKYIGCFTFLISVDGHNNKVKTNENDDNF